jgi:hypothetical protein
MCVHCWRLRVARPILSSLSPMTKHEKKEAGPAMYGVQVNDVVVSVDPGRKDTMSIAAPKRGTDFLPITNRFH